MLRSYKPHVGIFGRRNVGKSSFINFLAGEDVSIVSDTPGTTTDPNRKHIELGIAGPIVLVDTAGIDDVGELGNKRVNTSKRIIRELDLAILIITENRWGEEEDGLIDEFKKLKLSFFVVHNKSDLLKIDEGIKNRIAQKGISLIEISSKNNIGLEETVALIDKFLPERKHSSILGDLVDSGDMVLLVTPIDSEAPEGRMILPQVQAIRDVLDNDCVAVVLKENALQNFISSTSIKPRLVVTDSQVFQKVNEIVPPQIMLTSFSILFARLKGDFDKYLEGTFAINELKDGDRVLVLESCSHHSTDDDIGRIKIPKWLSKFTGKKIDFEVVAGLNEWKRSPSEYSLVVQCGGCMATRTQVLNRIRPFIDQGVPVTNYGMVISFVHGIFDRAILPFKKAN